MTPQECYWKKRNMWGLHNRARRRDANTLDPAHLGLEHTWDLSTCSPKEDTQMANKHTKKMLNITDQ